ncbi:MAG: 4-(cytidine 5'-diphospho)-2-C-methyl-D-erythritol kinase [Gammaproteobacteria bacterium]|nr:4-(cytidine 5'-diphospho)-2-C-methyl-D-erythritol kinase [Gammaproteobacteria bacterium]
MNSETFLSPAKLNLMLHITGQRADGYHNLQTVFQLISLYDEISIEINDSDEITRSFGNEDIAEQDDLLIKAAHLLKQQSGHSFGANIGIKKNIPMGGGLGGGSSNAATVLLALNKLLKLGFSLEQLLSFAAQLGADVPVFVFAQSAWAEGIGEQLEVMKLPKKYFLVLHPQVFVSTGQLFSSEQLTRTCSPITIRAFLEGEGKNVFQPLVLEQYEEVKKAFNWLSQFAITKLTGTGACLFCEFDSIQQAQKIQQKVPHSWSSWVVEGLDKSPLHQLR